MVPTPAPNRAALLVLIGIALVLAGASLVFPATVRAQTAEPATEAAQGSAPSSSSVPVGPEGGSQWNAFSGYGFNHELYGSAVNIDIATAGIRWSRLWEARGGGFVRGHPGLGIEVVPVMGFLESGRTTWAIGANLLYEHHFAGSGRVLPIWKVGVGILYASRAVPQYVTRHNFSLMTDFGVDITITDKSAVYLGYRFHHISNASTGEFNPGINAHSVVVGLSFYR